MRFSYTKKDLEEYGVEIGEKYTLYYKDIPITLYRVYRSLKKPKIKREIKPCINVSTRGRKKMYIVYKIFGTSSISAAKLFYVWFKGDIDNIACDVDHIDNNSLNNDIENLQILTHRQNCMKKYQDNPEQYDKDVVRCEWMRFCRLADKFREMEEQQVKELLERIEKLL